MRTEPELDAAASQTGQAVVGVDRFESQTRTPRESSEECGTRSLFVACPSIDPVLLRIPSASAIFATRQLMNNLQDGSLSMITFHMVP